MSLHGASTGSDPVKPLDRLRAQGYDVVQFDQANSDNDLYHVIAFKRNDIIGRGSYGNVYKGYPVNIDTAELDKTHKLAIKIYKTTNDINQNEARFFNSYYGGCQLLKSGSDTYMVMSFLPGKNIMENTKNNKNTILDIEISKFTFSKRVDLIANIMMAMNIIHHNTPKTGNALVHGDINGTNIRINMDPETDAIDVYIVDFGLADEITDEPDSVKPTIVNGTPLFMSNEIIEHEVRGVKSDIYALTPIFAAILGAKDPFTFKMKIPWYKPEYFKTPYDFTGMYADYVVPVLPFDVTIFVNRFLSRMQNEHIDARPDSDDCLKFFVTLNKLLLLHESNPDDQMIYACGATLAVLADGVMKDCIRMGNIAKENAQREASSDDGLAIETKAYFDFDSLDDPVTLRKIIFTSQQAPLKPDQILQLLSGSGSRLTDSRAGLFASIVDINESAPVEPPAVLKHQ